jgi:hypothetical protein
MTIAVSNLSQAAAGVTLNPPSSANIPEAYNVYSPQGAGVTPPTTPSAIGFYIQNMYVQKMKKEHIMNGCPLSNDYTQSSGPLSTLGTNGGVALEMLGASQAPLAFYGAATSTTGNIDVEFRPDVSMFNLVLPLFLMKGGIEIRLQLDYGAIAYKCKTSLANLGSIQPLYQISNPRFMGTLITPHPDIVKEYVANWKGQGLIYSIPSVRTVRLSTIPTESTATLQFNVGVRSARQAYLIVTDTTLHENSSGITAVSNALSTYLRSWICKYQAKVGSFLFPSREVTSINPVSPYWNESMMQLAQVSGSREFGFDPREFHAVNDVMVYENTTGSGVAVTGGTAAAYNTVYKGLESTNFIMAFDFARDNGVDAALCGIDLSLVPLEVTLQRQTFQAGPAQYNAACSTFGTGIYDNSDNPYSTANSRKSFGLPGSPAYYLFVVHDAYLVLSAAQTVVLD